MSRATKEELATLKAEFPNLEDCCGNQNWRGHLCQYHQGWIDGWDERGEPGESAVAAVAADSEWFLNDIRDRIARELADTYMTAHAKGWRTCEEKMKNKKEGN